MTQEELQSPDLGQGSVKDKDDTLAPQEASLQIVPYVVLPEVPTCIETGEENKLYMHRGEDILQCTRIFSCFKCPPIPLCRFIPYAKVRGLRDDVTDLKTAFAKEGYMPEKGAFIASIWTCKREETILTGANYFLSILSIFLHTKYCPFKKKFVVLCICLDDIMLDWDPLWIDINKEYEQELSLRPELAILSNKMYYIWEGNHRNVAWRATIKEKFSMVREKHCRVLCTIIDPTKVPEIALLSSLQRMNL